MIEESETSYNLCIDELKKNNITAKIHEISVKNLQNVDSAVQNKIESVFKIASQYGCAIGVIGGFVRDLLLGNPSHDVDFVVFKGNINKLTEQIGQELNGKIGKMSNQTLTTQIRFPDGIIFEFNSTRKEHYEHPSRMPIVEKGTLVDDLFRRDFTINAFIMFGNKYIDVFDGTNDLQNLIIQTTREPTVVFREDYLRMFRAIRFSCMLNFEIDKRVKEGIRKNVEHLKFVPHERILDELKNSISSNPLRAFRLMVDLNIFETIFPEIKNYPLEKSSFLPETVWKKIEQKLRYMLDNKITDSTFLIAVILLEFDLDMTLEKNETEFEEFRVILDNILRRLKFSNKEVQRIRLYYKFKHSLFKFCDFDTSILEIRLFLRSVHPLLDDFVLLSLAENGTRRFPCDMETIITRLREVSKKPELIQFMPKLNGYEINELFGFEGRVIGDVKLLLVTAIMNEEIINTRESCIKYLKKNKWKIL